MGTTSQEIFEKISNLADKYSDSLKKVMEARMTEMESDDNSHYLLYKVLGITDAEGKLIDEYQNKGRFLYKYAGSFLEEATILCFEEKFSNAVKKYVFLINLDLVPQLLRLIVLLVMMHTK